jgi:capsid protein
LIAVLKQGAFFMKVFQPVLNILAKLSDTQAAKRGPSRAVASRRALQGRYDAAQTTSENSRHWANAGAFGLTPDQMNNQAVRQTLKVRSRYEYNNGGYTKRIVNKTANEVVGKHIKINIESDNAAFNEACERDLRQWQREIQLEKGLRTLVKDKMREGEAIALPYTNRRLRHAVKLDLARISCDRLTSPTVGDSLIDNNVDGVILDEMGINVTKYQVSKYTGTYGTFMTGEYAEYNYDQLYHWFEQEYSEQHRGIPELTSTLDINAARRAYSKSVLSTAQMQANFAMYMKTSVTNPDQEMPPAMDEIELERNIVTILPENSEIGTVDASQPVDTFKDYNNEMVMEGSAPGNMPHNMVKASSADMNFSSARFDYYIMFGKDRDILRSDMELVILDDLIMRYIEEWAALNFAQFPAGVPNGITVSYGYEVDKYIDPKKETEADQKKIERNNEGLPLETFKDFQASKGRDYKDVMRQSLVEKKEYEDMHLEIMGRLPDTIQKTEDEQENNGDNDDKTDD